MSNLFSGPALVVHILIAAALNAIVLPLIVHWSGSILAAFLISVALLAVYGIVVVWIFKGK